VRFYRKARALFLASDANTYFTDEVCSKKVDVVLSLRRP
jgi:hypothetical protein